MGPNASASGARLMPRSSSIETVNRPGVSRMTINRALRELTIEGALVRMQGVGTFVAEPKGHAALFEIHNIAEEIEARGHEHRCRSGDVCAG